MNSENPPPHNKPTQASIISFSLVFLISGITFIIFSPSSVSAWSLTFIGLLFFYVYLHFRESYIPIPLVSWTETFHAATHDLIVVFQMPLEFNTLINQKRLEVAVRVALKELTGGEPEMHKIIEKAVEQDVEELKIPVFRVHIVNTRKKDPPPAPPLTHDIVAAEIIEPANPLHGDIEFDE